MSDRPDKCRWCGAAIKSRDIEPGLVVFACDSWVENDGREYQWIKCKLIIAERRIAAAVAAIETIDRYSIEGVYDFGAIGKYDKKGDWLHFEDLETVLDVLQGNSPEGSEGSIYER